MKLSHQGHISRSSNQLHTPEHRPSAHQVEIERTTEQTGKHFKVLKEDLPLELRSLVKSSIALLGKVIHRELGEELFQTIESLRKEMTDLRGSTPEKTHTVLDSYLHKIEQLPREKRFGIAHSFSLMLELMNTCENAYRTYRLRQRSITIPSDTNRTLMYVLTAHPTEARSPQNIAIFQEIHKILIRSLQKGFESESESLQHYLELAWRIFVTRQRKPSVKNEAEHIFSILFQEETLNTLLKINRHTLPIYIRSWVGGDKDGHPGVNEHTLIQSWQTSRSLVVKYIEKRLDLLMHSLTLIQSVELQKLCIQLKRSLRYLKTLNSHDGKRVKAFHDAAETFLSHYKIKFEKLHPELVYIEQLLKVFPGMVVPLELRDSSDLIMAASKGEKAAITRMLQKVDKVSDGGEPRWYAGGLIISMANQIEHIEAACDLQISILGELKLPVIPLFEQEKALNNSTDIVSQMLESDRIRSAIVKYWNGNLEVMLGYSDSSKEVGVLRSRLAVAEAVHQIDDLCSSHQVTPLFFHGSGGSIDRGGGSVEEQTSWWPCSALRQFKMTIQGEMVERTFSSSEVIERQLQRIHLCNENVESMGRLTQDISIVRMFAERVRDAYVKKLSSPDFFTLIQKATPYPYLNVLKFGSRPTKRKKLQAVSSLRAIPWILCWTQTRVIFPTWWGIGTAWKTLNDADQISLSQAYQNNDLFRSFVKALGFTLAKVELPVWRIYLEQSGLSSELVEITLREFETELNGALEFVRSMSKSPDLLWFRPWLGTSIRLRSPMIHPLNLLEIIAIREKDSALLNEAVAGIAIGMMTTG